MGDIGGAWVIVAAIALAAVLLAEGLYLLVANKTDQRATINRRMRLQASKLTQEQVLIQLRKERGAEGTGRLMPIDRLRNLRLQSGVVMPLPRFLSYTTGVSAGLAFFMVWFGLAPLIALAIWPVLVMATPFVALRHMRKRRLKQFGMQLPEALELITRSLKAGHPVPVAISMVAREMADPIGSEFGMVADEVTYGSDLVTALTGMLKRVGHEDLPLFVTAVSIQATTGGNLREILDGLSATIRDRGKLRRKIRAISTEGRMSAYILTAVPALLATGMQALMPQFYGEVMDQALTWYLLGGAITWLGLGNAIMFKMASFKF